MNIIISCLMLVGVSKLVDGQLLQTGAVGGVQTTTNDEFEEVKELSKPFDYHANMPVITKRELANAVRSALDKMSAWRLRDDTTTSAELSANSEPSDSDNELGDWMASSMVASASGVDVRAWNASQQALLAEETTRLLTKQFKLTRSQVMRGLPLISVDGTELGKGCVRTARPHSCLDGRYRSLSGHCNNVQQPDWGAARTPLLRYAPARYVDHVARPVAATTDVPGGRAGSGPALPSARAVSRALAAAAADSGQSGHAASAKRRADDPASVPQVGSQHAHTTTMLSFFGQFVFHDLAHVAHFSATPEGQRRLTCCQTRSDRRHPECMPVVDRDPVGGGENCLEYIRSMPALRPGCNLGPRDQINLVTSYLDGSAVYGSSEERMRKLRTFSGGRLRSQRVVTGSASGQQIELLPEIRLTTGGSSEGGQAGSETDHDEPVWAAALRDCRRMASISSGSSTTSANSRCFMAGDERVNDNIGLTLMHTIWMREHNYLADKLAELNPHWRDERLFQEARRLMIAQLQHITYNEFLPSLLSQEMVARYNLSSLSQGYLAPGSSGGYDPAMTGGVSNELASAVMPFILSTIPAELERYSDRLEMVGVTPLMSTFMDGSDLFKRNRFDQYLMGMMSQSAMDATSGAMSLASSTPSMSPTLVAGSRRSRRQTNSTRLTSNTADWSEHHRPEVHVMALVIQRGRDHGLRSYLYWRQACQLRPQIRTWQDLGRVMAPEVATRLQTIYSDVSQLDLHLATLETPQPGASVGPTLACLLVRQFHQLKYADRYWYENDLPGSGLTQSQLELVRQSSLARLVCRNNAGSGNSFVQPSPMIASDPYLNAYQYCTNLAMSSLDLEAWREPVNSAEVISTDEISGRLERGRRVAAELLPADQPHLLEAELSRARRQLTELDQASSSVTPPETAKGLARPAAGYRYLGRPKRQALRLRNQSLILELATNGLVRRLVDGGKDRESPQSVESNIRDFLYSLETVQLENLLDNAAESAKLAQFIAGAGSTFLEPDQRVKLLEANDPALVLVSQPTGSGRSSSISANCQDDERVWPCDHTSPYRTITGWCNNLERPHFGQSFTAHDRLLPSAYDDHLSSPRQLSVMLASVESGIRKRLPSPRLISSKVHSDESNLHVRYSLALMQFGQFGVDHDLTRTPFSVAADGSLLDCSSCDSRSTVHRDCLPIEIPPDDVHFGSVDSRSSRKCLHFVRSLNGQTALGPRQQLNALTSYLDASEIYGSDNCEAKSLRAFAGGRLNSSSYPTGGQFVGVQVREILPVTRANPECVTPGGLCFHAGDQRASEQPGLTAMHTVFMRLHNSLANKLAVVNKHWRDEKLYQEARRIVGAIAQRVTYGEFAPRLLGLDLMSRFQLILKQTGYAHPSHYQPTCSASILNEFAAAAFRMGHTLIRREFPLLNKHFRPVGKAFQLRKAFFNSQRILTEPNLIDTILRGIVSTPIESFDSAITEELTNHLFERPREPFSGMDLVSLNIQRARDHGVPAYNNFRLKCNLTRARSFEELAPEMSTKTIERLKSVYEHVDDIDLFTGGLSESPVHGGLVGPTIGCIIGLQFRRLKQCDRFWHESPDPFVRFSEAQLAEIRKMTLAKIVCQESDNIDTIQRAAMDVPDSYLNPRVACSSLPSMDITVWRESTKFCQLPAISQAGSGQQQPSRLELGASRRVSACRSCTCTTEGLVCRSSKINCLKTGKLQSGAINSIMADKSCLVQCAWLLDMQSIGVRET